MKENIIAVVAVIALALSGWTAWTAQPAQLSPNLGAASGVTGMLAENYWPYLLYNNGFKTAKDFVQTTSDSATTTMAVGCIQTTATSTATPVKLTVTLGTAATGTVAGLANNAGFVIAAFGNCP